MISELVDDGDERKGVKKEIEKFKSLKFYANIIVKGERL
jgi:hypothetical protein